MPHEDYARATSQPRTITIEGVDYRVSRWTPSILGEIQAWLKTQVPNPMETAKEFMKDLPESLQKEIWMQAREDAKEWPPDINSSIGQRLLVETAEGTARLVYALLRRNAATLTLEKARDMADRMELSSIEELGKLAAPGEVGDVQIPPIPAPTD